MTDQPSLPYAGTEGYSGTGTSRALAEDMRPSAKSRQEDVLEFVQQQRYVGATVGEIREYVDGHHGAASRSLTNLHIAGKLVRLADVRNHAKVYVHPDFVGGRETERYQSMNEKRRRKTLEEIREKVVALDMPYGHEWRSAIQAVLEEIDAAIESGQ